MQTNLKLVNKWQALFSFMYRLIFSLYLFIKYLLIFKNLLNYNLIKKNVQTNSGGELK